MLEKTLVEHGSPTLARLKLGSLMNVFHKGSDALKEEVHRLNRMLAPKGLVLTVLRMDGRRALLYLFRCAHLRQKLRCPLVQGFLGEYGYEGFSVASALKTLRSRVELGGEFPHEIGVFLDYPLSDIQDFIRHGGRNCRMCGVWKVYSNEADAARTFSRYKKCKDVYTRLYREGCPLAKLTVATGAA